VRHSKKIFSLLSIATACLMVAACSSSSKSPSATGSAPTTGSAPASGSAPITVGLICSCSGPDGNSIIDSVDIFQAWVKTANSAGGIDGHQIKVKVADDGAVIGTSVSDAQTFISDHVDAIMDGSIVDQGWASAVQSANIPSIALISGSAPFYTNPDFYQPGQTEDSDTYAVVATAKAAGATNLGVIYCAEAAVCASIYGVVRGDGKQEGLPVTFADSVSATAPNYTAQCLAAQQAHVTALAVFDTVPPMERLAQDCAKQGYDPIYVIEGGSFTTALTSTPGIEKNLWTEYQNYPYWSSNAATNALQKAMNTYYPGVLENTTTFSGGNVTGWPAGILLEDAFKAGGLTASGAPTASEVVNGLESLKGDTLQGWSPPLTYAAGKPHPVDCWYVGRVDNGKPILENNGNYTCETAATS
jgi:branched-chain amino acid transport system substrate-binding protein